MTSILTARELDNKTVNVDATKEQVVVSYLIENKISVVATIGTLTGIASWLS